MTEKTETFIEKQMINPVITAQLLAGVRARLAGAADDTALLRRAATLARGIGALEEAAGYYDRLAAREPDGAQAARMAALMRGQVPPLPAAAAVGLPFLRLTGVLAQAERTAIWDTLGSMALEWKATATYSSDHAPKVDRSLRDSKVLTQSRHFAPLLLPRVQALAADIHAATQLGLDACRVGPPDIQLVSHLDGGHFGLHADPGELNPHRYMTYVYYCHRQPKRFEGGELVLFDPPGFQSDSNGPGFTRLLPEDNSLVLFNAQHLHRVLPVRCPSVDPLDGRLAFNGWFQKT